LELSNILAELRAERDRIVRTIEILLAGVLTSGQRPTLGRPKRRVGGTTAAGRRRLSIAMKKRWAEKRGAMKSPQPRPAIRKRSKGMSVAARKKLSILMKKRWAERKKSV